MAVDNIAAKTQTPAIVTPYTHFLMRRCLTGRIVACIQSNGFHQRQSRTRSRSRNQKRRAYDLVKTRLSESEAEAEEPNQSQNVGTCIVIGLSFRFCFRLRQSGFLDHKRNVSDGVVSGVGRNENVLILLTSIPSRFLILTKS